MVLVYDDITANNLKLLDSSFETIPITNPSEILRKKNIFESITLVLYNSGKLVITGKNIDSKKEVFDALFGKSSQSKKSQEPSNFQTKDNSINSLNEFKVEIGSDEALKGDTFGGIVVCAVLLKPEDREILINLGVDDSKILTDDKIKSISKNLPSNLKYHCISLKPNEYNILTKNDKVTVLLNKLHKECAEKIREPNSIHIVDKYPGCKVGDIMEEKAESKYLSVALASIIARAKALEQIDELSKKAGFRIPLGSTHVLLALEEIKKRKLDFNDFTKLHFRNVESFTKKTF